MSKYTFYKKVFFSSFFILLFSHLIVAQTTLYSIGTTTATSPATNSNWSLTSGGTPANITPSSTTTLVFDSNSTKCFLNGSLTIANIIIESSYTDTVNILSSSSNFTVSNLLHVKAGCLKFDSNTVFLNTGVIVAQNATVIASKHTTRLGGNITIDGNWIHNNGKTLTLNATFKKDVTLNHLEIPSGAFVVDSNIVVSVLGNLEIKNSGAVSINGLGQIQLHGDLINTNKQSQSPTGTIRFVGTGNQILQGNNSLTLGALPTLIIDKPSGTLLLKDTIGGINRQIRLLNGNIDASTYNSTVSFFGNITLKESLTLHHVVFTSNNTALNIDTNVVLTINGNMSINSNGATSQSFNGPGELHLKGNLTNRSYGSSAGGNGTIRFIGTGEQFLNGNNKLTGGGLPNLVIDKPTGTLFFKDTIGGINKPIRLLNGNIDASSFQSTVGFFGSLTLKESFSLHNVVLTSNNTSLNLDTNVTLTINGNLVIERASDGNLSQSFNGLGEIHLKGNLTNRSIGNSSGGNGTIRFIGVGEQFLNGNNSLNNGVLPNLIIDKPSGTLFLKDTIGYINKPIRLLNGTLDASTYKSTVGFLGNVTLRESLQLYHVVFTTNNTALNLDSNVVLTINGNMSIIGSNIWLSQSFNGPGEIHLKGNLTNKSFGSSAGGNGTIRFVGTGEQFLNGNNRLTTGGLPRLIIDKQSGTLFLKDTIGGINRPIRLLSGNLDAYTYNSTLSIYGGNFSVKESFDLNNVIITPFGNSTVVIDSGLVLGILGNLSINNNGSHSSSFNGLGEIHLKGNLINNNFGLVSASSKLILNGNTDQFFSGIGNSRLPGIVIDKQSGYVNFNKGISTVGDFIVKQGFGKFTDSLSTLNLFGVNSKFSNKSSNGHVEVHNLKLFANAQLGGDAEVKRRIDIGGYSLALNKYELRNDSRDTFAILRNALGNFVVDSLNTFSGRYTQRLALNKTYTVPFRNAGSASIVPVIFRLDSAAISDSSYFTLSTYGTNPSLSPNNRPLPIGMQAVMDSSQQEASQFVVDRYWKCNVGNVPNFDKATLGVSFLTTELGSPNTISPLSSLRAYSYGGNNQFASLNTTGAITAALTTINLVKPDNDCIILSTKQIDRGETTPESEWSGFGCNSDSSLCANIYTIPGARNSFQSNVFVNIEQGQSPISYLWSNNTTNPNLENYAVGEYRVTVTDVNNKKGILTTFAGHKLGWDSLFNLSESDKFDLQVDGGIAINEGDTTADVSFFGLGISKNVLKEGENGNMLFEIEKGAEFYGLVGYSNSLKGFMGDGLGFGLVVLPKENWDGLGAASQELYFLGGESFSFLGEVQDSLALSLRIKKVSDSLFLYKNGIIVYSLSASDLVENNENFQLPDISPLVVCITPNAKIKQMSCDFGERIEKVQAQITHCTNTATGVVLGNISFDYDSSATYIWSNGAMSSSIDSLSPGEYTCTVISNNDTLINSYSLGYYATWDTLIGVELQDKGGLQATSAISGQGFDGYGFSLNALQPQEDGFAQFTIPAGNSFSGMLGLTSFKDFDGEGQSAIIGIIENDILILCTGCSDAISFGNYDSTKSYTFYFSVEGNEVFIVKKVEDDFGSAFFAQKVQISRDENFSLGFVPFNSNSRISEIVSSFGTVLKATVTPIPGEKNSGKGSLSINAKGGVLPYMYNWSNGATTSTITDAPLGDYHVTVTDANDYNVVVKSFNGQYASWDTFIQMNENPDYSLSFDTLSIDSNSRDFVFASSSNRILENQNGNVSFEFDKGLDFVGSIVGLFTSGSLLNEGDGCAVMAQPVEDGNDLGSGYNMYFMSTWSGDFVYIGSVFDNLPMSIRFKVVNGDVLVYKNGIEVYRASSSQTSASTHSGNIQLPSLSPFVTVVERKNVKIGRVLVDINPRSASSSGSSRSTPCFQSEFDPSIAIPFSDDINWIYTETYSISEDFKVGDVVSASKSFHDLLGRPTQTQSYVNVENNMHPNNGCAIFATQNVYDVYGRKVLTTLPAPIDGEVFEYKDGFIQSEPVVTTGNVVLPAENYHSKHFDEIDGILFAASGRPIDQNKIENPLPVRKDAVGTVGWYYSANNTFEPTIDRTDYPYSRVEYFNQPNGSVKRASGVGDAHRMGAGHEVRSYSMVAGNELLGIYGFETELSGKVIKSIAVDPDGKESVTFTDLEGHTLATCLSGRDNGANVETQLSLVNVPANDYRDIHIPDGGSASFMFPLGGSVWTPDKIEDINQNYKTIQNITGPGFYRIKAGATGGPVSVVTNYHHFALYYYDRVGRMVKAVPPKGVDYSVGANGYNRNHTMLETSLYNNLGQLIRKNHPDEGHAEYLYKEDGNIRFSQNDKQALEAKFSYTNYDDNGRTIEVGEYEGLRGKGITNLVDAYNTGAAIAFQNQSALVEITMLQLQANPSSSAQWAHSLVDNQTILDIAKCTNVTRFYYDDPEVIIGRTQRFTRGKPTKNALFAVANQTTPESATWYSYDEKGQIEWTVQFIKGEGYKTIDYEYDASGNVLHTIYQKNVKADYFSHDYTYDRQFRLKTYKTRHYANTGFTSPNIEKEHAKYYYYMHGPLKRIVLGDKLQGIDYTYTIDGKLKAINNPNMSSGHDADGWGSSTIQKDIFGLALDYYPGDYKGGAPLYVRDASGSYDNNINSIRWRTRHANLTPTAPNCGILCDMAFNENIYELKYNKQGWMTEAKYGIINEPNGVPGSINNVEQLFFGGNYTESNLNYDLNGNILSLNRTGANTTTLDNLTYHYLANSNKLNSLIDAVASPTVGDIASTTQYFYSPTGQMTHDPGENKLLHYNVYGKVDTIYEMSGTIKRARAIYGYDANNYRTHKRVLFYTSASSSTPSNLTHTVYFNDLGGNPIDIRETEYQLATTNQGTISTPVNRQIEKQLYGANRVGAMYATLPIMNFNPMGAPVALPAYNGVYEIADHLGNVRATITDTKLPSGDVNILSYKDYYIGGWAMPGHQLQSSQRYRSGYQGQYAEEDPETGINNFDLRAYDPRKLRWDAPDPYAQYWSPYLAMGNNWAGRVDPDGGLDGVLEVELPDVEITSKRAPKQPIEYWEEESSIYDMDGILTQRTYILDDGQRVNEWVSRSGGSLYQFFDGRKWASFDPNTKYKNGVKTAVALSDKMASLTFETAAIIASGGFGAGVGPRTIAVSLNSSRSLAFRMLVNQIKNTAAKGVVNATGQSHHLLSNKIVEALNKHPLLKGAFSREDPRFIYNALDDAAHKGYQTWHRQYDKMVVDYIQANPKLTPSQFQSYLHDLYQQPWLQQRIPNVNLKW